MVFGSSSFLVAGASAARSAAKIQAMSAPAAPPRPAVAPWVPVVAAGVVAAMHVWKLPGVMDRVQADLGMSLVQAGVLMGVVQVAALLLGLALSLAADLVGMRRTLVAGLVVLAVGSLAGAPASQAWVLMATRGLEGLGFILVTVVAPALIRRETPGPRLSGALGWWSAFQGTALFLAVLASTLLVLGSGGLGWRGWWAVMAAVSLLAVPPVLRWVPRDPAREGEDRRAHLRAALGRTRRTAEAAGPWVIGAVFACYTVQWGAVMTFLPRVLTEGGATPAAAGLALAGAGLLNGAGNVLTGRLLARGARRGPLVGTALAWMAVSTVLFFVPDWSGVRFGTSLAVLLAASFSLVSAAIPATLTSLIVQAAPEDGSPAAAVGIMTQVFNLGNLLGPVVLAALADASGGWGTSWVMTVGASLLGLALTPLALRAPRAPGRPGAPGRRRGRPSVPGPA